MEGNKSLGRQYRPSELQTLQLFTENAAHGQVHQVDNCADFEPLAKKSSRILVFF